MKRRLEVYYDLKGRPVTHTNFVNGQTLPTRILREFNDGSMREVFVNIRPERVPELRAA